MRVTNVNPVGVRPNGLASDGDRRSGDERRPGGRWFAGTRRCSSSSRTTTRGLKRAVRKLLPRGVATSTSIALNVSMPERCPSDGVVYQQEQAG